ncbi:transcription repressor NadR [Thalassobacillus pellis]|uniref:transcription repressor NadR n=1 Tax=Thalassobacillus pellis TaxID=748008 RepID=UPI00196098C8|nr:transcription repressor NadR [Thalassobacillus pellis]MBM7551904.1 transcriptional regulator of NAD metabolism [Thalassobacillus pellis]
MTREQKKMKAPERRREILSLLQSEKEPIKGGELAEKMKVSRQVIVGDVSLLKAKNEPIIATSQGYLYVQENKAAPAFERTIACRHSAEQTETELNILVDHGVFIKDVTVEHPVYGDLTASLLLANRRDVQTLLERIRETKSSYLLELTGGIHLHTISADNNKAIEEALDALQAEGILLKS